MSNPHTIDFGLFEIRKNQTRSETLSTTCGVQSRTLIMICCVTDFILCGFNDNIFLFKNNVRSHDKHQTIYHECLRIQTVLLVLFVSLLLLFFSPLPFYIFSNKNRSEFFWFPCQWTGGAAASNASRSVWRDGRRSTVKYSNNYVRYVLEPTNNNNI